MFVILLEFVFVFDCVRFLSSCSICVAVLVCVGVCVLFV